MAKKISHPYPHAGAALSSHADAARPYPLSLSLSISLRLSLSQVHAEANAEHEVGVALDDVTEGWVAVERKVAPLGHLHRRHHHVQVSSPCSGRHPLSLSHHSSPSSSTAQGVACHGTLTTPVSSGGNGSSSLKRDGGGAQRRQGVRGGRGDETPLLEAVEALLLLPSPRRPHCSNCATVETLPLLDRGPRRSGNNVYLDGHRRAGPDLRPTCPDLSSDFFYF
jgi:hypothetical protein